MKNSKSRIKVQYLQIWLKLFSSLTNRCQQFDIKIEKFLGEKDVGLGYLPSMFIVSFAVLT